MTHGNCIFPGASLSPFERELELASSAPDFWPGDKDIIMNNPDVDAVGRGPNKPGDTESAGPSVLRASKGVGHPTVTLQQPQLKPVSWDPLPFVRVDVRPDLSERWGLCQAAIGPVFWEWL